MNNIDKLIIRRGKGNTEGLTYSFHRELTNSFNKQYQICIDLDNGINYQK